MNLTKQDLIGAREAARLLLDQVGLAVYLFEVEPKEGEWEILVEHPRDGAWHRVTLHADKDDLLRTIDDRRRRVELAKKWQQQLGHRDAA